MECKYSQRAFDKIKDFFKINASKVLKQQHKVQHKTMCKNKSKIRSPLNLIH